MAVVNEITDAIQVSRCYPRGEWFTHRDNYRVLCPHGEILWSAQPPAAAPPGTPEQRDAYQARLRSWRVAHLAEACERLRKKTGCGCRSGG